MIEKRAIDPSIQGFAGHFLEEEEPRGFEDTPNLGYTGLPVHHMVQHSEIEDRIEVFIGKGKLLDTPHRQNNVALRCTSMYLQIVFPRRELPGGLARFPRPHLPRPPNFAAADPHRNVARAPALDC